MSVVYKKKLPIRTIDPFLPRTPEISKFSLDDRITQLNKFEVLLLTLIQVKEFNEVFSAKKLDVKEPLFHSWLTLKLAAIPTESEALERVLKAHTVEKVSKRKQKKSQNLPTGAARYFYSYFHFF